MKAPFQDLEIVGLLNERCFVVEGSTLRIYLELSEPPPLGWSYIFSQVWSAVEYPGKRAVGVDDGALWIECPPEQVRASHLPYLEGAVTQTNARFRAQREQRELALEHQRELSRQTHAHLNALAQSFIPDPQPILAIEAPAQLPASRLRRFWRFIQRLSHPTQRGSQVTDFESRTVRRCI